MPVVPDSPRGLVPGRPELPAGHFAHHVDPAGPEAGLTAAGPSLGLPEHHDGDTMTQHSEHYVEGSNDDQFEREMRGYNKRQVDEFIARARSQSRELEDRLSRSLDDMERLRLELSSARQEVGAKPPHVEISERVGQILKLADDEAMAQKNKAADEITKIRNEALQDTEKLRADVKQETDKFRKEAHEQAERMLGAAQEQAENSIASARAESEKTRTAARNEAERSVGEAHKQAESTLTSAQTQARQMLDEATARATAIHDGAERRLNLLMSRHTEALRRLTEIRDVVTGLVAGEVARGSLEDEVAKAVANSVGPDAAKSGQAGNGNRAPGLAEGRHAPAAAPGGPSGPPPGRDVPADQGMRARPPAPPAERTGPADPLRRSPASDPLRGPGGEPSRGPGPGDPLRGPADDGMRGPGLGGAPAGPGSRQMAPPRPGIGHSRDTDSQADTAEQQASTSRPSHQAGPSDGARHAAD
jgi:cell division septum initiation protein DivIVA